MQRLEEQFLPQYSQDPKELQDPQVTQDLQDPQDLQDLQDHQASQDPQVIYYKVALYSLIGKKSREQKVATFSSREFLFSDFARH